MNELQFFSQDDPEYARGFRTILATEPVHAYIESWWPPGHIIGYEHEFVHGAVDFIRAIEKDEAFDAEALKQEFAEVILQLKACS